VPFSDSPCGLRYFRAERPHAVSPEAISIAGEQDGIELLHSIVPTDCEMCLSDTVFTVAVR
jgi:hypothetical protein